MNIVTWGINMSAIDIKWEMPTLQYVMSHNTNYPRVSNMIEIPNEGVWTYWIIQEVQGGPVYIPHPMHLHGHDFYVLGSGVGAFNMQTDPADLLFTNPPRRDTVFLPAGGWVVIAFPAGKCNPFVLLYTVVLTPVPQTTPERGCSTATLRGTLARVWACSSSRQRTRLSSPGRRGRTSAGTSRSTCLRRNGQRTTRGFEFSLQFYAMPLMQTYQLYLCPFIISKT